MPKSSSAAAFLFYGDRIEETIVALCPELALNVRNVGYFLDILSKRINKSFDGSLIISDSFVK